jgi:hypothetical protein
MKILKFIMIRSTKYYKALVLRKIHRLEEVAQEVQSDIYYLTTEYDKYFKQNV